MADVPRLLYIVVSDDDNPPSFRYTRSVLQSTLQLMGCKARHAFKMSRRVFDVMRSKPVEEVSPRPRARRTMSVPLGTFCKKDDGDEALGEKVACGVIKENEEKVDTSVPFELYQRLTTIVVKREAFLDVVCEALSAYKYVGPNQRADLVLACR